MLNRTLNKVINSSPALQETLLDLTNDSVAPGNLAQNETAHDREGENIVGSFITEDAEAWAVGRRNGVPVQPTDPTYHNNSYWYAKVSETEAVVSGSCMRIAGEYADAAEESSIISGSAMRIAGEYRDEAYNSAVISGSAMRIAGQNAENAEAWAVGKRDGEDVPSTDPTYHNNSAYWAEYARQYAAGGIHYKSRIYYADIPTSGLTIGDMYDIKDDFITDSRFEDGAGIECKAGTNIIWNVNNKWDLDIQGGGGGHTILDEDGITYPQRSKLQFNGAIVSDDETNDATIVDIDPTLRDAEVIEGKNLLNPNNYSPSGTESYGVTYTVNADGSVKANGATDSSHISGFSLLIGKGSDLQWLNGKKINGCTGGSVNTFSINVVLAQSPWTNYLSQTEDDEVISGIPDDASLIQVLIRVQKSASVNNKIFYPMISVDGGEYEPFYIPVKDAMLRRSEQRVLSAKNLAPNTSSGGTNRGITYTVNSKKIVTANGTATGGNSSLETYKGTLTPGYYIFSGGVSDDYRVGLRKSSDSSWIGDSTGNDVFVTIEENVSYTIFVWIKDGVTANNVVFKPMLRLASDPDNTYVPYAMTNRELTEVKVSEITSIISNNNYSKGTLKCWYKKIGKLVELFIQIKCIATTDTWINILNYSTIPKPALVNNYPIYFDIPVAGGTTQYPIIAVFGSSNLQVRKGTPEYYYHLHTTYISE